MSYGNYPDLSSVRRALVIKLRHLGDVLLTSPVFSHLQKALPQAKIDAYVYREASPMLEGHPAINEILEYDRGWKKLGWCKRMICEAKMLRSIQSRQYDLIINLTEGDRGALAVRWSKPKIRVGVDERKIYTHVVKNCPSLRHTVERQLDALRRIGIAIPIEDRELVFVIQDSDRRAALQKIPWDRFLLIHPVSRWRFKCWPLSKVAELSQRLIEMGKNLVFTGGKDESEIAMVQEITRQLPREKFIDLSGQISIKELGALIERAEALICVDSVPLHIASALKAPVVALFGPTSEITWGPWQNPNARVVTASNRCRPCYQDGCGGSKMSDCLNAISVERVISELEVLAKIRAPGLRVVHELINRSR